MFIYEFISHTHSRERYLIALFMLIIILYTMYRPIENNSALLCVAACTRESNRSVIITVTLERSLNMDSWFLHECSMAWASRVSMSDHLLSAQVWHHRYLYTNSAWPQCNNGIIMIAMTSHHVSETCHVSEADTRLMAQTVCKFLSWGRVWCDSCWQCRSVPEQNPQSKYRIITGVLLRVFSNAYYVCLWVKGLCS